MTRALAAAKKTKAEERPKRCAIYTRKSTTEGLDSDFNTLDAQRESAEHYIRSQAGLGWTVLPTRYDDGGFSGGDMDRPALQQLLDDVERGEIDVVLVYKVDRFSRSLLDFARMMERFEKRGVGFVSITQHFDTSTSMGRLVLNILLSFAQFEREMISERTRDKVRAARRRGKWTGGTLPLGYGLDLERRALVPLDDEAELVRLIFEMYLELRSIGRVTRRLNALGYRQKTHVTRKGAVRGGQSWKKANVHHLLRNPIYIGKIRGVEGETYQGEHDPIVPFSVFEKASEILAQRSAERPPQTRSELSAFLLTGLLRCGACGAAMSSSTAYGSKRRRYRYYRCCRELKEGVPCTTRHLAADEIEAAVVQEVRKVARNGQLAWRFQQSLFGVVGVAAREQGIRDRLTARSGELDVEAKRLLGGFGQAAAGGGRLLAERLAELELEQDALRAQLRDSELRLRGFEEARRRGVRVLHLLEAFEPVWDALVLDERREILRLLIGEIRIDAAAGSLVFAFNDAVATAESALAEAEPQTSSPREIEVEP